MKMRLVVVAVLMGLCLLSIGGVRAETDITIANDSHDTETESGDAEVRNSDDAFVGHAEEPVTLTDASADETSSIQTGGNDDGSSQSGSAQTGAEIDGQVAAVSDADAVAAGDPFAQLVAVGVIEL